MNVQAELRWLKDRVTALEALTARPAPAPVQEPAKRKRAAAPRPDDAIITKRLSLWSKLVLLHVQYGRGRLTKLKVCIKYGLGDPSDLCRFLSADDRRGDPSKAARPQCAITKPCESSSRSWKRCAMPTGDIPMGFTPAPSLWARRCSSIAYMSMTGSESVEELVEQERECLGRFRAKARELTGSESRAFEQDRVLQSGRAIERDIKPLSVDEATVGIARRARVAAAVTGHVDRRPARNAAHIAEALDRHDQGPWLRAGSFLGPEAARLRFGICERHVIAAGGRSKNTETLTLNSTSG